MKRHEEGTFAMMAVLYSPKHLLLIKNLKEVNERRYWKFIGETSKKGELPLNALVRALWEEGGFCIYAEYDDLGMVKKIGDDTAVVKMVHPPITIHPSATRKGQGALSHEQHFYKVRLTDRRLLDLSGKIFSGPDDDELFETKAVPLMAPWKMPDFFPVHYRLFDSLLRAA